MKSNWAGTSSPTSATQARSPVTPDVPVAGVAGRAGRPALNSMPYSWSLAGIVYSPKAVSETPYRPPESSIQYSCSVCPRLSWFGRLRKYAVERAHLLTRARRWPQRTGCRRLWSLRLRHDERLIRIVDQHERGAERAHRAGSRTGPTSSCPATARSQPRSSCPGSRSSAGRSAAGSSTSASQSTVVSTSSCHGSSSASRRSWPRPLRWQGHPVPRSTHRALRSGPSRAVHRTSPKTRIGAALRPILLRRRAPGPRRSPHRRRRSSPVPRRKEPAVQLPITIVEAITVDHIRDAEAARRSRRYVQARRAGPASAPDPLPDLALSPLRHSGWRDWPPALPSPAAASGSPG